VAETRIAIVRLRAFVAFFFAIAYVSGTVVFLALLADRGLVGAIRSLGVDLVGWFILLMAAGSVAIFAYPYERPSRRMRVFGRAGRLGASSGTRVGR
jgi:hypothetical protein